MPDGMGGLMGGGGPPMGGAPQAQGGVPPQAIPQIAQALLQKLGPQGCAMLVKLLIQALQGGGGAGAGPAPAPGM